MKQVEDQELELKNLNAYDIADIEDQYGISGEKSQSNFRPQSTLLFGPRKTFSSLKVPLILLYF